MTPTIKVEATEFQAALRQYLVLVKKDLSVILNRKLLDVLIRAYRLTPRASAQAIESSLQVAGYSLKTTKSGKLSKRGGNFVRGAARFGGSLVNRIVNKRRGQRGEPGLRGAAMTAASNEFVARRRNAIGTLQRGWSGSLRRMIRAVGTSVAENIRGRVKRPGRARPAKEGWSPEATAEYDLNSGRNRQKTDGIDPRVVSALQTAFNETAADMRVYSQRKMQERANQFNAK